MLFGFELRQQRLDGLSTSDGLHESVLPGLHLREFLLKARSLLCHILVLVLQPLDCLLHCGFQNPFIKHVRERRQHRLIEELLLELDCIRADCRATFVMVGAPIETRALFPMASGQGDERTLAERAATDTAQEVGRVPILPGCPSKQVSRDRASREAIVSVPQTRVDLLPQFLRYDAQLWSGEEDPLGCWSSSLLLGPAAMKLLGFIPHNLASIEGPVEHFSDTGGGPPMTFLSWRWNPLVVERLGNPAQSEPRRIQLKDATDHLGLIRVDVAHDMKPLSLVFRIDDGREDLDVVIPIDPTARHLMGLCFTR